MDEALFQKKSDCDGGVGAPLRPGFDGSAEDQ